MFGRAGNVLCGFLKNCLGCHVPKAIILKRYTVPVQVAYTDRMPVYVTVPGNIIIY